MYANFLVEAGKLVYVVGSNNDATYLKKVFELADLKNKIVYKCVEDLPPLSLKKTKPQNASIGILRSDWMNKILDKYPEMIIMVFNCTNENGLASQNERLQVMLKKVNKVFDVLKTNNKEDIVLKIVVTVVRQSPTSTFIDKIISYLRNYEKDVFIIQQDIYAKELSKYRSNWIALMDKNYDRKYKKISKKLQESLDMNKRINGGFKLAIMSQIIGKFQRQRYLDLYNALKYKFSQVAKKAFNFLRYIEIRELRSISDITLLRFIKFKIGNNNKEIPQLIFIHLNFFKMGSLDPNLYHIFLYYEQLQWRSLFLENLLQVLYSNDLVQILPKVTLAELVNGLLSYLYKISRMQMGLLTNIEGKQLEDSGQAYLGKYNFKNVEFTEVDIIFTGLNKMINHRKDYISKGIQLVIRYKTLGIFKENQINFLNIYLIRFYLADGKFASIISIYNQILMVQVNRCNYFLINQLFNEIKDELDSIDQNSKVSLYGVASLICDYFQSKDGLEAYLNKFLSFFQNKEVLPNEQKRPEYKNLFQNLLNEEAYIYKLKKNSNIFAVQVCINDKIILCATPLKMKLKICINNLLRKRISKGTSQINISFNHLNMNILIDFDINQQDGQYIEREIIIQPLKHVSKDCILKIETITLLLQNKNIVWLLERNQIIFQRYDATLFYCKMEEPEVIINGQRKIYYINEAAYIKIQVKTVEECKVVAKFFVREEEDGKTQFFHNLQEKKNLNNSKYSQQLIISTQHEPYQNIFWIKCNKLGNKILKLNFSINLQKCLKVSWREKELTLKSAFSMSRQINFNVANLFTIAKVFKEALTGNIYDNNVPINKKMILSFYIKTSEHIKIKQLSHHNNPRNSPKIKYYKNIKLRDCILAPSQDLKVSMLFEINDDCKNEFDLFLTTLYMKWSRLDSVIPIENLYLDQQTKINSKQQKALISFEQASEIHKRRKSNLTVNIQNLTNNRITVFALMESTEHLLRIGDKGKSRAIGSYEKCELNFEILAIHSGIFQFPPMKIQIDGAEVSASTANLLVYCL